jgi:CRISPR/Cas system-associated exonuclease Cas4 (RecB family)
MTAIRPDIAGLPETVPARMVNEFVYCPRLFHLEWVQGRFALNDDVEEGLYVHRVVDEPGGDLPAADDDLERFAGRVSRSLWLTSTDLGISARLDVAEVGADGTVVPVDYKKGSPDKQGSAWPSDEVQALLQALLLRDAGYRVPRAEIWYAEPRRRMVIDVTHDRLQATRTRFAACGSSRRKIDHLHPWLTVPSVRAALSSASACPTRSTRYRPASGHRRAESWHLMRTASRCTSWSRAQRSPSAAGGRRWYGNGRPWRVTA